MNRRIVLLIVGSLPAGLTLASAPSVAAQVAPVLQPSELCSEHSDAAIATFEDPILEAQVRREVSVGPQEDLPCGLVSGLTDFRTPPGVENLVESLVGIQNLPSLTTLVLANTSITDISALSGLTSLAILNLANTSVTDISALSGLTGLSMLRLDHNPDLNNIQPLLDNTALGGSVETQEPTFLVDLRSTNVSCTDAAALRAKGGIVYSFYCPVLQRTSGDGPVRLQPSESCGDHPATAIATFEDPVLEERIRAWAVRIGAWAVVSVGAQNDLTCGFVSGLTTLSASQDTGFELFFAGIMSLVGIQNLTSLTDLRLGNNSITDVSALRGLTALTQLLLSGNPISDIQPLLDNPGLGVGDSVRLLGTSVSCADGDALRAKGVRVNRYFPGQAPDSC